MSPLLTTVAQATMEMETTTMQSSTTSTFDPMVGLGIFAVALLFTVIAIVAMWRIFTKAGQPGWASIVPIYNIVVLCRIAGRPGWWAALFFVPIASIVVALLVYIDLAKSFGRSTLFGILTWLFGIPLLILGFGNSQYVGAAASNDVTPGGTASTGQPLPPTQPTPASEESTAFASPYGAAPTPTEPAAPQPAEPVTPQFGQPTTPPEQPANPPYTPPKIQ